MKTLSSELRTHLDSDVTALATCWIITRRDGSVLRFTDCDDDVVVEGETYISIGAYSRTAIESTSTLSVDNLEVSGIASVLLLPVEELRAGLYDNASVKVFLTAWTQAVPGMLKLRRGFFGEVQVLPNGTFTVELRGLMQRLAHTYTDVFSATCRNDLGDSHCSLDISHPFVTEGAHIPFEIVDPSFEEAGLGNSAVWYDPTGTDDVLFTLATSYSGTYAATGGATGGYLVQDIDISSMGEDFLETVDKGTVTLSVSGRRRDNGGSARLMYDFLDYQLRPMKVPFFYDSNNGGMDIPEISIAGDFTFEAWINPQTVDVLDTIFFWMNPLNGQQFRRLAYGADGTLTFQIGEGSGGDASEVTISVPAEQEAGVWFHVAVVREGAEVRLYLDGQLAGEGTIPGPITDMWFKRLGYQDGVSARFDAFWDEIRIWNVARSQPQINRYRFQDLPDATPNLVRYYPFESGLVDAGVLLTGSLTATTTGLLVEVGTPVAVSYRGDATSRTTGYVNVGTTWTLQTISNMEIPPHTRIIRVTFQHLFGSPAPSGSLLDSLYGHFKDPENTTPMPNFSTATDFYTRGGMVTTGDSNRVFQADIAEPRAVTGWFNGGLVTFYSGKNRGSSMEVKTWDGDTKQLELFLSLPFPVEQGDLFTIYPGCDKSRICCSVFFDNIANFFGTPDIPGEDELFRYPDAK
jgi:uncharacterized phage protein (TIGR02218 family)